jgi:hypothetical protein
MIVGGRGKADDRVEEDEHIARCCSVEASGSADGGDTPPLRGALL